jgi:hypothetical protein
MLFVNICNFGFHVISPSSDLNAGKAGLEAQLTLHSNAWHRGVAPWVEFVLTYHGVYRFPSWITRPEAGSDAPTL